MKAALTLLLSLLLITSVRAADPGIEIEFKIAQGTDLLAAPKVVFKPGKDVKIDIVKDFRQPTGAMIPVGVIMAGKADLKGEKITYSFVLTIRNFIANTEGDKQWTSSFKTRDYLFSGEAISGKPFTADLGNKETATVTLTLVKPKA
jgi:hypothetical protein